MTQHANITNLAVELLALICTYKRPGDSTLSVIVSYITLANLTRHTRERLINEETVIQQFIDYAFRGARLHNKGLSSKTVAAFIAKFARLALMGEHWKPLVYKAVAKYNIWSRFYTTIIRQDPLRLFECLAGRLNDLTDEYIVPLYLHATLIYHYGTRDCIEIRPFDSTMWQTASKEEIFVYVPREKSHDYEKWDAIEIEVDGQDRAVDLCRLWPMEMTRLMKTEREYFLVRNYPPLLEEHLRYNVQRLGHNDDRHVFFQKCSRLVRHAAQETLDVTANTTLFDHYIKEALVYLENLSYAECSENSDS